MSDSYPQNIIIQRRDAAILRALTTPSREQKAEAPPQSAKAEAQRKRRQREKSAASATRSRRGPLASDHEAGC